MKTVLLTLAPVSPAALLAAAHGPRPTATVPAGVVEPTPIDSILIGVFEGRTPCGSIANDFTQFPAANCEKVKWEVTLRRDARSPTSGTYSYRGTRSTRSGHWLLHRGAAHDPAATVYRLHYGSGRTLPLLSIDDRVLLLLDEDLRVLAGDASWSYALNRGDRID
jgi:hypothetical protein